MGIIGIIAVGVAAISGYKYCKEEEFRNKVNDNVKKASEKVKETAINVKDRIANRRHY